MTSQALALVVALAGTAAAPHYDDEAMAALESMEKSAVGTNDYTMRLVKRELRGTALTPEETIDIRWQRPQRI